jgi:hypothetical protein
MAEWGEKILSIIAEFVLAADAGIESLDVMRNQGELIVNLQ